MLENLKDTPVRVEPTVAADCVISTRQRNMSPLRKETRPCFTRASQASSSMSAQNVVSPSLNRHLLPSRNATESIESTKLTS